MISSAPAAPMRSRPRLRFTLAGMFVCLLGIAVGLACWRLPQGTVAHGLFASFSTWFLIGQIQKLVDAFHAHRIERDGSPVARWRFLGSVTASLGIIFLVAAAVWVDLSLRLGSPAWFGTAMPWVAGQLRESIFFLAVLLAYWQPIATRPALSARSAFFRSLKSSVLLGLSLAFGAVVIWSIVTTESFIIAVVHYAIRGVQEAQPLWWAGHPFSSPETPADQLGSEFVRGAAAAAALVLVSATAVSIAFVNRRSSRPIPLFLLLAASCCLLAAAWLLVWCYNSVLAEFSPAMRDAILEQPAIVRMLAALAIVATAALLAQRIATHFPGENPFVAPLHDGSRRYLGGHWGVMSVCLLGVLTLVGPGLVKQFASMGAALRYDWRPWAAAAIQYATDQPHRLLAWAVFLALGSRVWNEWRGRSPEEQRGETEPTLFAVTCFTVAALLLVGVPVLAWLGCAIALARIHS